MFQQIIGFRLCTLINSSNFFIFLCLTLGAMWSCWSLMTDISMSSSASTKNASKTTNNTTNTWNNQKKENKLSWQQSSSKSLENFFQNWGCKCETTAHILMKLRKQRAESDPNTLRVNRYTTMRSCETEHNKMILV